jgi:hypothetical protein
VVESTGEADARVGAEIQIVETEPTFARPVSQRVTQAQIDSPEYAAWCASFGESPRSHRKQWEWCYILQALKRGGCLKPGRRGLGFGVGREPLPAVMAAHRCQVLATDQALESASKSGWCASQEHARSSADLPVSGACSTALFEQHVSFRECDMRSIPEDLRDFDFCWSSCAFEHLGSIDLGLEFVHRSVACLRAGGVAVHTTELNLSSNSDTLSEGDTVLFRHRDIERLAAELQADGNEIVLNFSGGVLPADAYVDVPPYSRLPHLKLRLAGFISTSFGLVIRRGAGS